MATPKSINEFPPDVADFIHNLVATAIIRAMKNGEKIFPNETFNQVPDANEWSTITGNCTPQT